MRAFLDRQRLRWQKEKMKAKPGQRGFTLVEMTVVIVVVALLVSLSLPTVRTFFNSLALSGGTRNTISAALAAARAIAAREQRYAGIRFQQDLKGHQYIIFIIQDPEIGAYFFRAVAGVQPIKLPETVGVMEFVESDAEIYDSELMDKTTLSVIFSPRGKLVIHEVQVRNRDGQRDTVANLSNTSHDDIFNKKGDVDKSSQPLREMGMGNEIGMFYQDDYFGQLDTPDYPDVGPRADLGLGPELSRNRFIIYDKTQFAKIDRNRRWSDYLKDLDVIYINAYTGRIISAD